MIYNALVSTKSFAALHRQWYPEDKSIVSEAHWAKHDSNTVRRALLLLGVATLVGNNAATMNSIGLAWEKLIAVLIPMALTRYNEPNPAPV